MAGFSQPQHFLAAGCIFADFVIAAIFYHVIKFYENFCAYYLGVDTLRNNFWKQKSILQKFYKFSKNGVKPLIYWIFK